MYGLIVYNSINHTVYDRKNNVMRDFCDNRNCSKMYKFGGNYTFFWHRNRNLATLMVFVVKFNGGRERSFELWSYAFYLSVTMYHFAVFSGELLNKRDLMHFHSWTGKRGATLIWTPRVCFYEQKYEYSDNLYTTLGVQISVTPRLPVQL